MGRESNYQFDFGSLKVKNCFDLLACKSIYKYSYLKNKMGVLGQNDIWVLALWLGTENITREKVVASLKFGLW
jgi:hypothetical protein